MGNLEGDVVDKVIPYKKAVSKEKDKDGRIMGLNNMNPNKFSAPSSEGSLTMGVATRKEGRSRNKGKVKASTENQKKQRSGTWTRLTDGSMSLMIMEQSNANCGPKRKCEVLQNAKTNNEEQSKRFKLEEETKKLSHLLATHLERWRLLCNPNKSNESVKLELSGVWEPPDN